MQKRASAVTASGNGSLHFFAAKFTFTASTPSALIMIVLSTRETLLDLVERGIAQKAAAAGGISRQAASRQLSRLVAEGVVEASGRGRGRKYRLKPTFEVQDTYRIGAFSEDDVWEQLVRPVVADLPRNLFDIWHHGTTEMVNNAIDHSEAASVSVFVERNHRFTSVCVVDLGVGILVSRSQAKRLTARFERFRLVVLDFEGVDEIGQAFADELFRVFQAAHPTVSMLPTNMTPAVEAMFRRVLTPQPEKPFFGPE